MKYFLCLSFAMILSVPRCKCSKDTGSSKCFVYERKDSLTSVFKKISCWHPEGEGTDQQRITLHDTGISIGGLLGEILDKGYHFAQGRDDSGVEFDTLREPSPEARTTLYQSAKTTTVQQTTDPSTISGQTTGGDSTIHPTTDAPFTTFRAARTTTTQQTSDAGTTIYQTTNPTIMTHQTTDATSTHQTTGATTIHQTTDATTIHQTTDTTTTHQTTDATTTTYQTSKATTQASLSTPNSLNMFMRGDGMCGQGYPAPNGEPAICDPNSEHYCCSAFNFCGGTPDYCSCDTCIDYRVDVKK